MGDRRPALTIEGCSPELLAARLASRARPESGLAAPAVVDLRSATAFRSRHIAGAVSIPRPRLLQSLFLLPPRTRPLVLTSADGEDARLGADTLVQRGWREAAYLRGSPLDLDPRLLRSGAEPNRIWEPPPWLRRFEPRLPKDGTSCDVACGSGRAAVYLALGGRHVIGADILRDALIQARTLAWASRIPPPGRLSFRRIDLTTVDARRALLHAGRFRVVCCFRYLDRPLLPDLATSLAPGGWLLYETFLEEQAVRVGKPSRPAYLLKPDELREAFSGLEVVDYREGPDEEGNYLASLAARRR